MILKLSLNAQKSFEDYLNQVKICLKGVKSVDAEEIQQQITEHIENELSGTTEPVSSETLNVVLNKLGSPQQWVPEEELSWWKKFALRVRTGPEDWRLAYISFGLLIAGFLFPPSLIVLVPASYLVSRAALSLSNYNIQVKALKWLTYPSLIIVYVALLLFLLSWPLFPIICFWGPKFAFILKEIGAKDSAWIIVMTLISVVSLGLLYIALGIIFLRRKRQVLVHIVFKPFAGWFNAKWCLVLIAVGAALFVLSICASVILNRFELIPVALLPGK